MSQALSADVIQLIDLLGEVAFIAVFAAVGIAIFLWMDSREKKEDV